MLFGGGRRHLLPQFEPDPEYRDTWGQRGDGRNLVEEWLTHQSVRGRRSQYVWSRQQLQDVREDTDHVMGKGVSADFFFSRR